MKLNFELNGRKIAREIAPDETLLHLLRDCGMHSVRGGCDSSNCGICTVWVDGKPVLSCGYPAARAEGRRVTTLEGVHAEAEELMRALADEGADQCGFCSPGFLMCALAMFRELENPTEDEMRRYLAGNLCRCTGYASQMRALAKYAEGRRSR